MELKKYNPYLDKRSEIMKNTQLKVHGLFSGILNKDSTSPEQITNPNNFQAKMRYI